jgi:bifunctional enzyme CysN/CysC
MSATFREGEDVAGYLRRHEHKELLRLVTVGSVDDGKSTLIGRLLHDAHGVYDDQLSAVARASKLGGEIDFSLFTDGLRAEREQGITIDVAYRYFSTEKRKFIIADTPGHVQYTRNMATGASTADVALILIDARLGVLPQSRRHAFIASLLGISDLVACVNKMDLVGYDAAVFDAIKTQFSAFAAPLGFRAVHFIPISALRGENVVQRSDAMPFYEGPPVLELLESVPLDERAGRGDFRFPVQMVLRPNLDYRAYAGQVVAGTVRAGDEVLILPSRKRTTVSSIDTYDGALPAATAPQSVALRLADEVDISRGEMIVHPGHEPRVEQHFEAMLVWMHERRLDREKSYLLKHTTRTVRAEVERVVSLVDLESLGEKTSEDLGLNDIGRVSVRTHRPLFLDAYKQNRGTGAFILIDSLTNDTVAAGMILQDGASKGGDAGLLRAGDALHTQVSASERRERIGHTGGLVLVLGAGDAARAAAYAIERHLFDRGCSAAVLEGAREGDARTTGADERDLRAAAFGVHAGLIVIAVRVEDSPGRAEPWRARLGGDRVLEVQIAGREPEAAAEDAWSQVERAGWFAQKAKRATPGS